MKINNTKDYEQFEMLLGNRPINQKKVDKIKSDIESGFNMLPYFPILVKQSGEKFGIIDGQHRYRASRETGNPVYFLIGEDISMQQIALLNSRGEKWKPQDYVNCYTELGHEDYITLKDFLNRFEFPIYLQVSMLMDNVVRSSNHSQLVERFTSVQFKVNHREETEQLFELVHRLFSRYNFYKDRELLAAVQRLIEGGKCNFDVLEDKISRAPMLMEQMSSVKTYIYKIEEVYNYKNQIRQVIY